MKRAYTWIPTLFVIALVVSLPLTTIGQSSRDKFVISAKAGGVNAVTGRVTMRAHGESDWQQLTIKQDLEAGDAVRTSSDGRLEMLLNPGSYLRIGENSEVELSDNSLQNLEVRLTRGTAIVEATGFDGAELLINITTPHTRMAIVRKGLYRVSVVPGDATELIVRKGRVMLDGSHTKVNGGNKVVFSNNSLSVAKLTDVEKKPDNLEIWSKDRAKTVAQANRGFSRRDMGLAMLGYSSAWGRNSSSLSGIWMYSAGYRCYTFFPFHTGWGSPYGSSYYNSFYTNYRPWYSGGYPGPPIGYTNPGTSGNPGNSPGNQPSAPPPTSQPHRFEPREQPNMPSESREPRLPITTERHVSPNMEPNPRP